MVVQFFNFSILQFLKISQSFQWTLHDVAKQEALVVGRHRQLFLEVPGHAADERHGQVTPTIRHDVSAEEVAEAVDDQAADSLVVQVVVDERAERR